MPADLAWKVEYAKSGQSTCKYPSCKRKIAKNELRVGITQRGAGGGGGGSWGQAASYARFAASTQYFHVECCATKLRRAKSLRRPESASQLKGFDELDPRDKEKLCQALGIANDMPGSDNSGAGCTGQLARALSCNAQRPTGGSTRSGWTQSPRREVATQAPGSSHTSRDGASVRLISSGGGASSSSKGGKDSSTVSPHTAIRMPAAEQDSLLRAVPDALRSRLMPFQREGVAFGVKRGGRMLLADEMGLGKTVQAIGIASAFRRDWPLLVVAPSAVKLNWAAELEQWLPELEPADVFVVRNGHDTKPVGKALITIITYGLCSGTRMSEALADANFQTVIVDESHYLKSRDAQRTKVLLPMLKRTRRCILLSGTPALSRPEELFTQIHAIDPATYGDFRKFAKRYCDAHMTGFGLDTSGASNLQELHGRLQKLMIRRLKRNVLPQLPEKRRQRVAVEIKAGELSRIRSLLDEGGAEGATSLDGGAAQHDPSLMEAWKLTGSAKLDAISKYLSTVCECGGVQKLLVFAHHLEVLDHIESFCRAKKWGRVRIDGSTSAPLRLEAVEKFQADRSIRIAILGMTAAGVGITMTAASTVLFAELHWTPATILQAEDRVHRIGQKSAVNVQFLVAQGTVDDIIWSMLCRKLSTVGSALDGARRARFGASAASPATALASAATASSRRLQLEDSSGEISATPSPQLGTGASAPSSCSSTKRNDLRVFFGKGKMSADTGVGTTPPAPAWSCHACTFDNKANAQQCAMCLEPRRQAQPCSTSASASASFSASAHGQLPRTNPTPPLPPSLPSATLSGAQHASGGGVLDRSWATNASASPIVTLPTPPTPCDSSPGTQGTRSSPLHGAVAHEIAVSPQVMYFSVSKNTRRIFIYDASKQFLRCSVHPDDITNLEDDKERRPEPLREAGKWLALLRFMREWRRLKPQDQKKLCNQAIRTPLSRMVQRLRSVGQRSAGLSSSGRGGARRSSLSSLFAGSHNADSSLDTSQRSLDDFASPKRRRLEKSISTRASTSTSRQRARAAPSAPAFGLDKAAPGVAVAATRDVPVIETFDFVPSQPTTGWVCAACLFHNADKKKKCAMCDAKPPPTETAPPSVPTTATAGAVVANGATDGTSHTSAEAVVSEDEVEFISVQSSRDLTPQSGEPDKENKLRERDEVVCSSVAMGVAAASTSNKEKDRSGGTETTALFMCQICCEDRAPAQQFRVDSCGHTLCVSCVERMAKNGKAMFACPFCKAPITNYSGAVAKEVPRWATDPEALLADEIADDTVCVECGQTGLLVLCDVCDAGWHHTCAGINPAHEPDSWLCPSCSAAITDNFDDSLMDDF